MKETKLTKSKKKTEEDTVWQSLSLSYLDFEFMSEGNTKNDIKYICSKHCVCRIML